MKYLSKRHMRIVKATDLTQSLLESVREGDLASVEELIEDGGKITDELIQIAIGRGNYNVAKFLLDHIDDDSIRIEDDSFGYNPGEGDSRESEEPDEWNERQDDILDMYRKEY